MITNTAQDKMPAREVLRTYKQQYGVEKNFSFLKEPLIANDTFLKKPSRIDAWTFILLARLSLFAAEIAVLRPFDALEPLILQRRVSRNACGGDPPH